MLAARKRRKLDAAARTPYDQLLGNGRKTATAPPATDATVPPPEDEVEGPGLHEDGGAVATDDSVAGTEAPVLPGEEGIGIAAEAEGVSSLSPVPALLLLSKSARKKQNRRIVAAMEKLQNVGPLFEAIAGED